MPFTKILRYMPLLLLCSCKPGKLNLKLQLEPGQAYQYFVMTHQVITQNQLGESLKTDQFIAYGMKMEVMAKDDSGNYVIRTTCNSVKFRQSSHLGTIVYDSDKKDSTTDPAALPMAGMAGNVFEMLLSPAGRVKKVGNYGQIMNDLAGKLLLIDSMKKNRLQDSIRKYIGPGILAATVESGWHIYPDIPIKEGAEWKIDNKIPGQAAQASTTYTLEKADKGKAYLRLSSKIIPTPARSGFAGMSHSITGSQEGQMEMDIATGIILTGHVKQHLQGEIHREGIGESMSVPFDIQSEVHYKTARIK